MATGKNNRQIEVYRAMTMLKRGRPADVIRMVAPLLEQDENDAAFKRAVHRDLKSLMHSNQIGVDYYTPAGDLIPPGEEDQHQNVRVEYFLLSHMDQEVTGYQRFHELGGDMISHSVINSALRFSEDFDKVPVNSYRISIEMRTGFFIQLWFPREDRPIKLIFARASQEMSQKSVKEEVFNKIDKRTAVILLPNKSVSRLKSDEISGHCELQFTKEENQIILTDHKSHNGTVKAYGDNVKKSFMDLFIADQTMDGSQENIIWGAVKNVLELEGPNLIKAGNCMIFIESL